MISILDNLPDLVIRKVYRACDAKSKWNWSKAYYGVEHNTLKRAGCFNYKEDLYCYLCQNDSFLNGSFNLPNDSLFVGFEKLTKPLRMDRLKRFIRSIETVFHTQDVNELEDHLKQHHGPNYFRQIYWDDFNSPWNLNSGGINLNWEHLMTDFRSSICESQTMQFNKMCIPSLVSCMFEQLEACCSIGNAWNPIYIDGKLLPGFKALQSFNMWLYIIEQQHKACVERIPHIRSVGKLYHTI